MPSEMQERIARAIYEADWGPAICVPWGKRSTPHQGHYRNIAIAVMNAMLEPTADMEVAGTEAWLCESAMEDRARSNWKAMISHEIAATEEARHDQD